MQDLSATALDPGGLHRGTQKPHQQNQAKLDNCQRLTDLEGGDLQVVTLNASQATKKAGIFLGG